MARPMLRYTVAVYTAADQLFGLYGMWREEDGETDAHDFAQRIGAILPDDWRTEVLLQDRATLKTVRDALDAREVEHA